MAAVLEYFMTFYVVTDTNENSDRFHIAYIHLSMCPVLAL